MLLLKIHSQTFSVTVDEFKAVFVILILSGYNNVPRLKLYWSTDSDVHHELIVSSNSRNRFDEILSLLHFADNNDLPIGDKFVKVLLLLTHLYLEQWSVAQKISIDKCMVPYYGRHG